MMNLQGCRILNAMENCTSMNYISSRLGRSSQHLTVVLTFSLLVKVSALVLLRDRIQQRIGNTICLQYKQSWNPTQGVLLLRKKEKGLQHVWMGWLLIYNSWSLWLSYCPLLIPKDHTLLTLLLHAATSIEYPSLCPWRWVPWWNDDTTSHRRKEKIMSYPRRASLEHFLPSFFGHCQVAAKAICKLKTSSEQTKSIRGKTKNLWKILETEEQPFLV